MNEAPPGEPRVDLYRAWSSRAAAQAENTEHPGTRTRCTQSAELWTLIADAIEAGQGSTVDHLTGNLLLMMEGGRFIAAGRPCTE